MIYQSVNPCIESQKGRLKQLYGQCSPGQEILFFDETYTLPEENLPENFYALIATKFEYSSLESVRNDLLEIVGKNFFHSTEALKNSEGRECFEKLVQYFSNRRADSVITCKTSLQDEYPSESARRDCIRDILTFYLPKKSAVRGLVFESRNNLNLGMKMDARDQHFLKKLREEDIIPSIEELGTVWASPTNETLLWAPDIIGMAFRRTLTHTDQTANYFFDYLNEITEVREI